MESAVVVEYKGRHYLVPDKIRVEELEHNGRVDGLTYYTNGKEFWGKYWTNSNVFDRCGCCGEFYTEFKRCGCERDVFDITKEEYMKLAIERGLAKQIPVEEAKVLELLTKALEMREILNDLLEQCDIHFTEVDGRRALVIYI